MKRLINSILLLFLVTPVISQAAVTLTTGDTSGSTSFNTAGNWSQAQAPHAGTNYSVAVQFLRTPPDANSYTFAGDSLMITNSGGIIYKGTAAANTYTFSSLVLYNGGLIRSGAGSGNTMILAGAMSVLGTNVVSQLLADQSPYTINAAISGTGSLLFSGGFTTTLNGTNSFTGSTSVSGLMTCGASSVMTFKIGGGGTNNSISGVGTATFNGRFAFDLSAASTNVGASWTIASTTVKTFGGTFSVDGFARQGFGTGAGTWNLNTNGVYYEFVTSSGVLSVVAAPSSSSSLSLALTSTRFDGVEADVALSYSPDAASREGGEDNIQVNLANAIAGANATHKRSGTGVRLRIAGFYQSTANPVSVDNNAVLGLVNSDAAYQDVRDFGVAVGADLVSYYSYSTGAAGNAYQPGMYSAMGEQWIYYLVVGHELGHNYGCAHQDGKINPKTVMMHNYCGGGAQGWFSNPQIWLNGVQLIGDGDTCLSVAQISGGDNASRLAGAAVGVSDNRARIITGPNLNNVVLHWMFTNAPGPAAAGTTNYDLVSGAPAVVRGLNATYTGSALRIPGGSTGNVAMNVMAAYIDLPNGIISARTNITIEIWATPQSAPSWARLIDFGRTTQAGDGLGASGEYTGAPGSAAPGSTSSSDDIMLSVAVGTDLNSQRFESKLDGAATTLDANLATTAGVPHHYAITFTDGAGAAGSLGGRWQWYRDGDPIAFLDVSNHLASIEDVNNWLGRSMWSDDSMANNDYTEVRVSSVALSPGEVLANFMLGPDYQPTTSVSLNASDASGSSSFNSAGQWSSGATPNAANSYETFDYLLRTPATASAYTFGGNTLKISGGELLCKSTGSSTITVTNLILNSGVVHHSGSGTMTLAGNIAVSTNSAEFNAQSGPINVTAPVSGLAPVYFLGNTVTLSGNNSNYVGKVMIGNGAVGAVQIDSEARLGSLPGSFNSDQLTMNRGTLLTTTSMTLSNTTRGILLDVSGGTFNVASGTILTLASTLSSPASADNVIAGTLAKAGPGTLILSTTNTTFKGMLYVDSGSTTASDGVVRIVNNQALANAHTPIYIRNNNSASSTLQLDGTGGNITLPQGISLSGRTSQTLAIQNLAGSNTISGGMSINVGGANYLIQSDAGTLNLGGTITSVATGARTITFQGTGSLNIPGSITDGSATVSVSKRASGTLTMSGTSVYTGTTTVTGGSLLLNGSLGTGAVSVGDTAAFGGTGSVAGSVTVQSGGTFAPGNSIGTMSIGGVLTLQSGSTTRIEISKTGSVTTNDAVVGSTAVNLGGALVVTNVGAASLAAGDAFKIFSAAGFSGAFTTTSLPALPDGLAWANRLAMDGVLSVVPTAPTNLTWNVSGANLTLSWPSDYTGWQLEMQTNNLANGISLDPNDWATVTASQATNQISLPIDANAPAEFYRLVYP